MSQAMWSARRSCRVLLGALAACSGAAPAPAPAPAAAFSPASAVVPAPAPVHVQPKALWTYRPAGYFSDLDFLDASAVSRDLVVLANRPSGDGPEPIGVIALDVATGTERWHKDEVGWLLHPPHATEPLYFAPAGARGSSPRYTRLERIDPRTGKVLATIALRRDTGYDREAHVVWSATAALVIAGTTLTAFDWTTGAPLWHTQVADNAYLQQLVVQGDRIYLANNTNLVISLVDGKQLAAIPGVCCTVIASPDGRHVFLRAAVNASLELDPALHVVRHTTGEVIAASNTYYAIEDLEHVEDPAHARKVVRVLAYDQAKPVAVLTPRDHDDYYAAIALSERHVLYYHLADHAFAQQALPAGEVESIDPSAPHDGWGARAEPIITRPIVERPYVVTAHGFVVQAYSIGDE